MDKIETDVLHVGSNQSREQMNLHAFDQDGFDIIEGVLEAGECAELAALTEGLKPDAAGNRGLLDLAWCCSLASKLRSLPALRHVLPTGFVATQCTYFEKSRTRNWLVSIHQDRSIPVEKQVDHSDLRGWSRKEGELYVQPPVSVLAQIVAIRVHLDIVGENDGPLEVVPGSHRIGLIEDDEAVQLRQKMSTRKCVGGKGSVLAMRPLLLHQSSKARGASLRRTLDFRFGPAQLPYNLKWRFEV